MTEGEFLYNGSAPEFFANGLYDVEVMGAVSRFVLFVERRTVSGVIYRETAFTCIMPNDAIGPGIAMTVQKAGASIIIPAATGVLKHIARSIVH